MSFVLLCRGLFLLKIFNILVDVFVVKPFCCLYCLRAIEYLMDNEEG